MDCVTVVVSGLPNNVPLTELARNIDKIISINDVGTFRVRDIESDSIKRLVGLDFRDGFQAMDVLILLDGIEYEMDDGRQYTLKCKISNDPRHKPCHADNYIDMGVIHSDKPRHYSNAIVPYSKKKIEEENSKLNAQLILLKKKKMIVEAERELIKAKRKLKKEYTQSSESESSSSSSSSSEDIKSSKRKKKRKKKKTKSKSRDKSKSESREKTKSKIREIDDSCQVPSISRESQSRSMRSQSRHRRSQSRQRRSQSRHRRSQSRHRRSHSRSQSSNFREERYRMSPPHSRTRSPSQASRINEIKSYLYNTNDDLEPQRERSILKHSPLSIKSRSPNSYNSRYSNSSRESPSRPTRSRNVVSKIVNIKKYSEHIYINKSSKWDDANSYNAEDEYSKWKLGQRIEDAQEMVIKDVEKLVYEQNKSFKNSDIEIIHNEFKNYIKNEFRSIKSKLNPDMTSIEIVRFYRRGRTLKEDEAFLLNLMKELISMDTEDMDTEGKKEDATKRRSSTEMWNEVEEVLQEIPMALLQNKDENDDSVIIINQNKDNEVICIESSEDEDGKIKDGEKTEILVTFNITTKASQKPVNDTEKLSSENIITQNDKNVENSSKPSDQIVAKADEKAEEKSELPQRYVPVNPLFVIPVQRLMKQMSTHVKKLHDKCEDLYSLMQTAIRARIVELLKDRTNYMKTAEIIATYRSSYPKENDESFINEVIEKNCKVKAEQL